MVDREAIEQRLARLEREIRMVAALREQGRDRFLADEGLQHQAERALQVSIQICIDIAAHVVAALALRAPDGYRELFDRLAEEASLDSRLAVRLKEAVGQRNLLVHAYLDSDPARVWEKLEEVGDLRAFARWALEQASG